jgi:hypothetical protein
MRAVRNSIPRMATLLLGLGLLGAVASLAKVPMITPGGELPKLRGGLLSGRSIVLPDSARGSALLLLLGFTYESRHDVEAWAERFRRDFGADSTLRCYEIPVIGGAARLARPFIDGGMRRGTPRALHERVITVYRDAGAWKQRVGFSERDVAYLLLVDRWGRVVWQARGPFGEAAYAALAGRVRELPR